MDCESKIVKKRLKYLNNDMKDTKTCLVLILSLILKKTVVYMLSTFAVFALVAELQFKSVTKYLTTHR